MVAILAMLHSALHRIQTYLTDETVFGLIKLHSAFHRIQTGGLLRSFSKRGEHTASEGGMHLEC